ncbi:hypothetical protein [Pengzhenrongella phosphoraccumulans]|jgi:hypothetical protein|uniref:hypothetical protein n=1 Tax=Pengzhenrongella phosphoraccumulans TaxID=3114394 RepID=UPI00388E746B
MTALQFVDEVLAAVGLKQMHVDPIDWTRPEVNLDPPMILGDAFSDESEKALFLAIRAAFCDCRAKEHDKMSAASGTTGLIGRATGIVIALQDHQRAGFRGHASQP